MRQAGGLQLRTMLTASALAFSLAQFAHATTISGNLTVDNAFYAYISASNSSRGTLVASGNSWPTTFSFGPFALTPGQTYYLQIEGINYGEQGALIADLTLSDAGFHFANGTQALLTDLTDWSASFNDSNSDPSAQQPWVAPTGGVVSDGANGVSPWGTRPGISGSALWIDAATNGLGTCQNCTVDFSTVITPNAVGVPEPGTLGLLLVGLAGVGLIRYRRRSA